MRRVSIFINLNWHSLKYFFKILRASGVKSYHHFLPKNMSRMFFFLTESERIYSVFESRILAADIIIVLNTAPPEV